MTFWAWGPLIKGMVSIMVAGAPEASRMGLNLVIAVRSATEEFRLYLDELNSSSRMYDFGRRHTLQSSFT